MPRAVLNEDRVIWVPKGHVFANNERAYDPDTDVDLALHTGYDFNTLEADERRVERAEKFSRTIDRMNPLWYNELTSTQQTELATWRATWLDYPSTGTKPDDLDIFD